MVDIQIKVTVPEVVLNSNLIRHQIMQVMQRKTAPDLQRLFKGTVSGWENPPTFLQKFKNSPGYVSTTVWPGRSNKAGKTYILVTVGAAPHTITPRRGGMLRFQTGYRAGTTPRVLSSRRPSRFGRFVSARQVRHPGFEARDFDDKIAEVYAPTFERDMQETIRIVSVKSG